MGWFAGLAAIALGLALLAWFQRRERAALWARRGAILADCLPLVDSGTIGVGRDGFPCLAGLIAGRQVRADVLPDTLTLRRLPQLWLSLTILTSLPQRACLGVLVRPSGAEFYARTPDLPLRFEAPAGFPSEVMVRGDGRKALEFLEGAHEALADLLQDPRVKEVLLTPRGLRIVYQAAEGQRGQHLVLRQCDFGEAKVDAATFMQLYDGLEAILTALQPPPRQAVERRPGLRI